MHESAIPLLRVVLVVLLLGSVLAQVAMTHPEVESLVVPYSVAAILFIGCGQVALLVTWHLLSLVGSGAIFTRRSLRWVDALAVCGIVATLLAVTVTVHVFAVVPGHGGPMHLYLAAAIAGGLAFVLLVVVMRGLLVAATADRADLDGVI